MKPEEWENEGRERDKEKYMEEEEDKGTSGSLEGGERAGDINYWIRKEKEECTLKKIDEMRRNGR